LCCLSACLFVCFLLTSVPARFVARDISVPYTAVRTCPVLPTTLVPLKPQRKNVNPFRNSTIHEMRQTVSKKTVHGLCRPSPGTTIKQYLMSRDGVMANSNQIKSNQIGVLSCPARRDSKQRL
jgi:hypothetical protein